MSLTTDRNNPCLDKVKENGQQACYLILSDEERAKGFIRPLRFSYTHLGINWNKVPHELNVFEKEKIIDNKVYVATLYHVQDKETGKFIGGRYLTQNELDQYDKNKYTGGCGTATKMHISIAETYARNPKFYGATFCCGCGTHINVNEFVWEHTHEIVGS